jgi:hypothetical protein
MGGHMVLPFPRKSVSLGQEYGGPIFLLAHKEFFFQKQIIKLK